MHTVAMSLYSRLARWQAFCAIETNPYCVQSGSCAASNNKNLINQIIHIFIFQSRACISRISQQAYFTRRMPTWFKFGSSPKSKVK